MKDHYSLEAGRQIYYYGLPFISISREGETVPAEADDAARVITHLLNLLEYSDRKTQVLDGGDGHTLESFRNSDLVTTVIERALR